MIDPSTLGASARRVFLVDDDDVFRDLLGTALQRSGFSPQLFASGRELLGHLEQLSDASSEVDAAVVDYYMPDVTGLTLLQVLTSLGRGIPTVVMSGSAEHDAELLGAGASAVLHKPFSISDLCDAVNQAINDS